MKSDHQNHISIEHDLYCRTLLKENDRDFYFLSLLHKDKFQAYIFRAFWLLLTDIEKIRRVTAEPAAAALRLKWWMDAIENLDNHKEDDPTKVLLVLKQGKTVVDQESALNLLDLMQQEVITPQFSSLMQLDEYLIKKSELIAKTFLYFTHHQNSIKIIHRALWIRLLKSSIYQSTDAAIIQNALPSEKELKNQLKILKNSEESEDKWLKKLSHWSSLMLNKKSIQTSNEGSINLSDFRLSGFDMIRLYFK